MPPGTLRPWTRLRHRQIDHLAMEGLDVQRIAAKQAPGQCVMDMRFDCSGAVERLTQADHPSVGVDTDPEHVGELFGPERFDGRDLHSMSSPGVHRPRALTGLFCSARLYH